MGANRWRDALASKILESREIPRTLSRGDGVRAGPGRASTAPSGTRRRRRAQERGQVPPARGAVERRRLHHRSRRHFGLCKPALCPQPRLRARRGDRSADAEGSLPNRSERRRPKRFVSQMVGTGARRPDTVRRFCARTARPSTCWSTALSGGSAAKRRRSGCSSISTSACGRRSGSARKRKNSAASSNRTSPAS